jgi:L-seryl-tRNA(Ser) seleniumtransferase
LKSLFVTCVIRYRLPKNQPYPNLPPMTLPNPYRTLPGIDALLKDPSLAAAMDTHGHDFVVNTCRTVLAEVRTGLKRQQPIPPLADLIATIHARLDALTLSSLQGVINGTGVIIHTNLGRAPLSTSALHAMTTIGSQYSTLEWEVESGKRGSRYNHVGHLLAEVTGAEAAVVVNNAAAALVLVLSALGNGREAVMSRAHLIEIGGGFRIPDIMRQSGVQLREVGTTNRTYARDYAEAITPQTALFMRMHSSNFRIEGFVHQPKLPELTEIAHAHNLWVVDDLGSGALLDTALYGLSHEPMVQESIKAGADLVIFSGDKLLGGPQAGCIVGRRDLIQQLRKHPLIRALRVDKTTLAGLDATLRSYQRGKAITEIPVWRMIAIPLEVLEQQARQWADSLTQSGIHADVRRGDSTIGGGSLPGETLPTWVLALLSPTPNALAATLRHQNPIIVGRIEHDCLLFDPRTVLEGQAELLLNGIKQAIFS